MEGRTIEMFFHFSTLYFENQNHYLLDILYCYLFHFDYLPKLTGLMHHQFSRQL